MERLHKVLARAGVTSRRKAEDLIQAGRVRVNGKVVSELGTQVDAAQDRILVDGKVVRAGVRTYVILHKPRGYLSDRDEERGKPTVFDLVPSKERLYAAGRLDANSEGLLLLTNDGELAHRLTHPRFGHEKEYRALVEGAPDSAALELMRQGIWYEGDLLRVDRVEVLNRPDELARQHRWADAGAKTDTWLSLVLHEGKKREIRHLCGAIGHPVKRLVRVRIGPIGLGKLAVGQSRSLTQGEVQLLAAEPSSPAPRKRDRERQN